jgi:hypothetical protein
VTHPVTVFPRLAKVHHTDHLSQVTGHDSFLHLRLPHRQPNRYRPRSLRSMDTSASQFLASPPVWIMPLIYPSLRPAAGTDENSAQGAQSSRSARLAYTWLARDLQLDPMLLRAGTCTPGDDRGSRLPRLARITPHSRLTKKKRRTEEQTRPASPAPHALLRIPGDSACARDYEYYLHIDRYVARWPLRTEGTEDDAHPWRMHEKRAPCTRCELRWRLSSTESICDAKERRVRNMERGSLGNVEVTREER